MVIKDNQLSPKIYKQVWMRLGINLCIPCTPKDPEWVVYKAQ